MQSLFERFAQASPKTYKQYGGSGLGLFISRELCELQGGQIGVSSSNKETTFTFFVKAKRWVESRDPSAGPRRPGFASTSASPMAFGRRGSVALTETAPPTQPAKTTAPEAAPGLKASPAPSGSRGIRRASPAEIAEGNKNGMLHVLIVEDNLINQKVMSQQLRKAGCVVHLSNHGEECLSFLEQTSFCNGLTPLSIILLDLEMPVMDGLTCIRQIRERQGNGKVMSHVPVIAVTANARSEQVSVAIDAGMDQVVTKPFRIPELMPQMKALVAEVAQRGAE